MTEDKEPKSWVFLIGFAIGVVALFGLYKIGPQIWGQQPSVLRGLAIAVILGPVYLVLEGLVELVFVPFQSRRWRIRLLGLFGIVVVFSLWMWALPGR